MKTLLLNITYIDNTNRFWFDSLIKDKKITFNPDIENIHEVIKNLCEEEGMSLTYRARPQGNVYQDTKDGKTLSIGYMYRGKSEIYDRNMPKPSIGFFDVWVTIYEVIPFSIDNIDNF